MARKKALRRKTSNKKFKKGLGTKGANLRTPTRGGTRL